MTERPCPEQFSRVAKLLECNSLFGMQFIESDGTFVICWCDRAIEKCNVIKHMTNCETLAAGDFIGHEYFTVKWYDYNKIPVIYNSLIVNQIGFTIKHGHCYHGYYSDQPAFTYTPETMERKFITGMDLLLTEDIGRHA